MKIRLEDKYHRPLGFLNFGPPNIPEYTYLSGTVKVALRPDGDDFIMQVSQVEFNRLKRAGKVIFF